MCGRYIEGKLNETHESTGKRKYTIEELLGLPLVNKTGFSGSIGKS